MQSRHAGGKRTEQDNSGGTHRPRDLLSELRDLPRGRHDKSLSH
jgi:hypothetical protein